MMQVKTNSSLEQIICLDKIQVLRSNPTLRSDGVIYIGNDFVVEKQITGIQTSWNGKKIIKLKTSKVIDNSKKQEIKEERKIKNGKDNNQKTNRVD